MTDSQSSFCRESITISKNLFGTVSNRLRKQIRHVSSYSTPCSNSVLQGKHVNHFEEIDRERLEFAFNTNIIAMFRLAQLAFPHMAPGSSIINTTSIVAYQPIPGILDYVCTKVCILNCSSPKYKNLTSGNLPTRNGCIALEDAAL
jgi:hypothetical protein